MVDYEIICPKCGGNGKFITHLSYDTFAVISCPTCNYIGSLRGLNDTIDFEIYTIIKEV